MIYATRRERIEAEKMQRRGRRMRTMKASMAGFATFAGVTVAGVAPAHADHTVESGDTLSGIAAQYDGVSVSSLMESNGLSSHLIYPGQNLSTDGSSSSSNSSSSASSTSGSSYTVVSGDTLGRIAAQNGTSVSALMSANNLSSHMIYPGDQLTIPGAGSSSSSSSNSSATPSTGSSSSSSSSNSSTGSSSSNNTSIDSSNSERVSSTSTASASTSGSSWAISTANSAGASYSLGANGAGNQWDCSSFSQQALSQDGKSIPRTSAAQYASAQKISKGQLQSGDLVFFGSGSVTHVAVYVGDGQIAHARNPSAGLSTNSLDSYAAYNNVVGYGRY